jgi:hypothetical protein
MSRGASETNRGETEMKMTKLKMDRNRRQGVAVVELSLIVFPLTVLLMGVIVIGISLGRAVQVAHVTRDAASMYVRGIDFSKDPNKDVVVRLSGGLGMTRTGGNGTIILSKVTFIPASRCGAIPDCNSDKHVITQRLRIGNASLRNSNYGSPAGIDSTGLVTQYLTDDSAIVNGMFQPALADGEFAYVAEGYFKNVNLNFPGFQKIEGVYSVAIF